MYGLPQSGKLANNLLQQRLKPHGFTPCTHTAGLWTHPTKPISFVLVVNDFAIKYTNKQDAMDLLDILHTHYTVKTDWAASTFCGIHLHWDYPNHQVHLSSLSMPGYIASFLDALRPIRPTCAQNSPYPALPLAPPEIDSPTLPANDKLWILKKLLYYARAIDSTLNVAISALVTEQATPTDATRKRIHQLLEYCATHPDAHLT